jgi:hypothetical protein
MAAGMFYWLVPACTAPSCTRSGGRHALLDRHVRHPALRRVDVGRRHHPGPDVARVDANGALQYPSFVETLIAIRPMYWMRLVGGTMYLVGFCLMAWNLYMTARSGKAVDGEGEAVESPPRRRRPRALVQGRLRRAGLSPPWSWPSSASSPCRASWPASPSPPSASSCHLRHDGPAAQARPRQASPGTARRGPGAHLLAAHPLAVLVGGVLELVPSLVANQTMMSPDPPSALHRARARGPRRLHPRGLLQLPLADDPPAALGDHALRRAVDASRTASSITPSSGARSAPAPTSPARAGGTRTSGTTAT